MDNKYAAVMELLLEVLNDGKNGGNEIPVAEADARAYWMIGSPSAKIRFYQPAAVFKRLRSSTGAGGCG